MLRNSIIAVVVTVLGLYALAAQQQPTIKRVPVTGVETVEGKELYQQFCAVCHGVDGKGAGPAAAALKQKPTDLTLLARQNKGEYPNMLVQQVIDGTGDVVAHGSREMPVWGVVLRNSASDRTSVKLRLYNLASYIEGLQAK